MNAQRLEALLGLKWQPVAVGFLNEPPAGLARVAAPARAGCGYWKLAAQGQAFYTEAADHYNCPVGALTHGIELPPEQAAELQRLAGMMLDLKYLREEEIPAIPRRRQPFRVAAYAPLASAPFPPDVVIVRLNGRQLMLLNEAAGPAGLMGRPTCAMLAEAAERSEFQRQPGLHRQPRVHGIGGRRALLRVPGEQAGRRAGEPGDRPAGQP